MTESEYIFKGELVRVWKDDGMVYICFPHCAIYLSEEDYKTIMVDIKAWAEIPIFEKNKTTEEAEDIYKGEVIQVWEDDILFNVSFPYAIVHISKDDYKIIMNDIRNWVDL